MGRKGFKGFVKAAKRPGEEEDEGGEEEQQAQQQQRQEPKPKQKEPKPKAAAAKPAPTKSEEPVSDDGSGENDEGDEGGPETRGKMLQRHKKEMVAHKKGMQRAGKKSKEEVAKLTAELEKRHAEELRKLDEGAAAAGSSSSTAAAAAAGGTTAAAATAGGKAAAASGAEAAAAADPLSKYLLGLTVDSKEAAAQGRKPSKAQKRREKHAVRDAEREARIAAEKEALGTPERLAEEAELKALLAPLGLGIKEIRADGHCMYRSLEDQLRLTLHGAPKQHAEDEEEDEEDGEADGEVPSYQELREMAAEYMREHRGVFAPYLVPEDEEQDPDEYFDKYCDNIEMTATWGGHVELQALAGALKRRIAVYGVGMQPHVLGEGFQGQPLTLCFLKHAFGLGAHYNSTRKLLFAPGTVGAEESGEVDE